MTPMIRLLIPVFLFYASWCGATLLILCGGKALGVQPGLAFVLKPFTTAIFLLLGAAMMILYMRRIEPVLRGRARLRAGLMIGAVLIAMGLFALDRHTGMAGTWPTVLATANLMFLGVLIGFAIIGPLSRPAEMIPLGLLLSLADLLSWRIGPTRFLADDIARFYGEGAEGPAPVADILLIKFAVPGIHVPQPVFGAADWAAVAFLTAAASKFRLNDNLIGERPGETSGSGGGVLYFPVAAAGLLLAVLTAELMGIILPALPVVAAVTLGCLFARYPGAMRMERPERILTVVFSSLLVTLIIVHRLFA